MSDPQAEQYLALDLRDLLHEAEWSEAQEYQFTTYCFEEPESRTHWLARVVGADVV